MPGIALSIPDSANVIPTLGCDDVCAALHPSNASPEIPINAIGISMRMH
ncbi:hypothetical protein [Tardiphaga robiniae]|jgi:hypothetical protein|uniref:Uncharacterized protein n=1 Tax=Tardiphaga robiniae TaxID=943830 RepID=A0A7G6U6R0_9BRAD|nr:hypothetical protein [Tardiphaga robiniae]QND74692.1 hypothetical protein HB776_28415 [Tardiphaga robiniae]